MKTIHMDLETVKSESARDKQKKARRKSDRDRKQEGKEDREK